MKKRVTYSETRESPNGCWISDEYIGDRHYIVEWFESSDDDISVYLVHEEWGKTEVLHYVHTPEGQGLQRYTEDPNLLASAMLALLNRMIRQERATA